MPLAPIETEEQMAGRTDRTLDERSLLDVESLTDNSTGTASDTIADAGATYNQANQNAFRASVTKKLNDILERLKITAS